MISEKKYSADCFRGKKYPALKKIYLSWRIILKEISYTIECQGKNYISRDLGKNILTQTRSPIPPPPPPTFLNSQWSPPKDKIEGL